MFSDSEYATWNNAGDWHAWSRLDQDDNSMFVQVCMGQGMDYGELAIQHWFLATIVFCFVLMAFRSFLVRPKN